MAMIQVKHYPVKDSKAVWNVQFRDGVPENYQMVNDSGFLIGVLRCQNASGHTQIESTLDEVKAFVDTLGSPCWEGTPFES